MKILIIEDDKDIKKLIMHYLLQDGYEAEETSSGEEALRLLRSGFYDLVILDWSLPGKSGLDVCRELREIDSHNSMIPVLMVTARTTDADIVLGLSMGADDYVTKPFSVQVLMARVRALLRRTIAKNTRSSKELHHGRLYINTISHRVMCDDKLINLSPLEFKILSVLMNQPGAVMTRKKLVEVIQGPDVSVGVRSIDVHISSLRQKLGICGDLIETVRGIGYRFR